MSGNLEILKSTPVASESLFSLEIVVDKLSVPGVPCRFPAVAFRLLDFPTLIIYHVDPSLGDTIKAKISADPHYRVPPQLNELKDKQGHFLVKKGKSCLFKIPPKTVHAHLMNTPLYVMLIDTYPDVPKLIGSCSIPLDDVMDEVYKDICNQGVSVPSAHGERGEYKLYNLMGLEIGFIVLGYRLLSLGMGLIPHIPDNAISAFEPTSETTNGALKTKGDATTERILQSIEAADKNIQVTISEPARNIDLQHHKTQTEKEILQAAATQTNKRKKKSLKKQRAADSRVLDEMTDFFITNMVCPPPLFFNSDVEKVPDLHQGLTFNDFGIGGIPTPNPSYAWGNPQETSKEDDTSSWSDDDTIRHEDKFSDSDIEEIVDFKSSRIMKLESKKSVTRKTLLHGKNMTDVELGKQSVCILKAMNQPASQMPNLQQMPLLNALLKEIMSLQGMTLETKTQSSRIASEKSSRPTSARVPQEFLKTKGKENQGEFLSRLATPRGAKTDRSEAPSTKSSHRVCAAGPEEVPKNKSWIRKNPQFATAVRKTKLTYGMTNAQRLRLAKSNPKLLEELEKDEHKRVELRRKQTLEKYSRFRREGILGARLMGEGAGKSSRGKGSLNFGVSFDSTGELLSDISRSQRKPIPTPRKSLSVKNGSAERDTLAEIDKSAGMIPSSELPVTVERSAVQKRLQRHEVHKVAVQDPSVIEEDRSDSQRSQKSIEVYLPSAAMHAATNSIADTSEESILLEGEEESVPAFGRTKVLYNPGFSLELASGRESRLSGRESRMTDYGQYSEDFENENDIDQADKSLRSMQSSGEEPSLRKIIEKYSDSDATEASAEEPSLRKVVERYSDDSSGDFKSARSHESEPPERVQNSQLTNSDGLRLRIPSSFMPNPMASILSPVTAMRPQIPPTGEALAASSPTETDVMSPDESTAYIRQSQIPTMSYDTATSLDMADELKKSGSLKPRPSPRRTLERISSLHTESVSSYLPSDAENDSYDEDEHGGYSDQFDSTDDELGVQPVKQMSELSLAPEAKMGYTWGYSRN